MVVGFNGDGRREARGVWGAASEAGAEWSSSFADLVACGLAGVSLVTSDVHAGMVDAFAAHLPGAS